MYNHAPKDYDCPFCKMVKGGLARGDDVVLQTDLLFACLSLHHHPDAGPTILIIPKDHYEHIYDTPTIIIEHVAKLAKQLAMVMRGLAGIEGITLWQNNEPCSSQTVWHYHLHLTARIAGDDIYRSKKVRTTQAQVDHWVTQISTAWQYANHNTLNDNKELNDEHC